MAKKYLVTLTAEEREQLTDLVTKGQAAAYKIKGTVIYLLFIIKLLDKIVCALSY